LILFTSTSQVIGWEDCVQNGLQCVKQDVEPCSIYQTDDGKT